MATPSSIEAGGNVVLGWVRQYGFATVVALALVIFLMYQAVVTDQRQADAISRVYELQALNRTAAIDIQARLSDMSRSQAEQARAMADLARSQADLARTQADLARTLERLTERLVPVPRT
jgi:peptidoglycan hydrolase CwlO-like protein